MGGSGSAVCLRRGYQRTRVCRSGLPENGVNVDQHLVRRWAGWGWGRQVHGSCLPRLAASSTRRPCPAAPPCSPRCPSRRSPSPPPRATEVRAEGVFEAGGVRGREPLLRCVARPGVRLDRRSLDEEGAGPGSVQASLERRDHRADLGGGGGPAPSRLVAAAGWGRRVRDRGVFARAADGAHIVRTGDPVGPEVERRRWRPWGGCCWGRFAGTGGRSMSIPDGP